MEEDKRKRPQQRTEDAEKQNAQQEREFREQKEGKDEHIKKRKTKEEAIEDYADIEEDEIKGKREKFVRDEMDEDE